jgi:hypothetical protein
MRVLEFFSGIGGWRCALLKQQQLQAAAVAQTQTQTQTQLKQDQGEGERVHQKGEENQGGEESEGVLCFEVAQAFDINTASNQVYQHNFSEHPSSSPSAKCINSLTRKMLDKHCADMWCMSPPCQPYTRNNNSCKRDTADQRANALLHLLLLLREVLHRPRYILLEVPLSHSHTHTHTLTLTHSHCTLSHCTLTHCTLSHCTLSHCMLSHCTLSHCMLSHCILSHCTHSHCTLSHCMLSHYLEPFVLSVHTRTYIYIIPIHLFMLNYLCLFHVAECCWI